MSAISVTAGNVLRVDGTVVSSFLAGATITAGQVVYVDANGAVQVGTNASSAGSGVGAQAVGIALNGGSAGQPIAIQINGVVNPGGTVAVGKIYALGTSGGIIPVDDIAGSEYITELGVGISASQIKLSINVSGAVAAAGVS